jgi:signal transduction histidine kinase
VIQRDPEPVRELIAAARARAVDGVPFAVFESDVAGVRYQTIVHYLYDGSPSVLFGLVGFNVSEAWVRENYFGELIAQIERISVGQNAIGIEILDTRGHVVASAGPVASGGPIYTRAFPLVFADRGLLSSLPHHQRIEREWMTRVTVANDPTLVAAGRGVVRTLVVLSLAAMVTIGALALIVRANREAAALAAMKAEFVSSVTHEMKTPLALISLASDTLAKGRYSSPETIEEYARMLAEEAGHLTRLIDNVLHYARISDVKRAYTFEPLDLGELIEESLDRFNRQLTARGFDVRVRLPVDLPRVLGDRAMMLHAVDNLIDNVIKYGDTGGVLIIEAAAREGRVWMEVADRGDGIHPDDVSRVFEKFYRGREAKQRGSGLGLAIVRRIIQDHGGRIAIRSFVGEGTAIEISIPAASST